MNSEQKRKEIIKLREKGKSTWETEWGHNADDFYDDQLSAWGRYSELVAHFDPLPTIFDGGLK